MICQQLETSALQTKRAECSDFVCPSNYATAARACGCDSTANSTEARPAVELRSAAGQVISNIFLPPPQGERNAESCAIVLIAAKYEYILFYFGGYLCTAGSRSSIGAPAYCKVQIQAGSILIMTHGQ